MSEQARKPSPTRASPGGRPPRHLQHLAGQGIQRDQKHGQEMYYINEALFNELAG